MKLKPALTYIALGGGTQSGCMMHLACEGGLGHDVDLAIFADTGDEPAYVYEQIQRCVDMGEKAGIPVEIVREEGRFPLSEHLAEGLEERTSISNPPWFMRDDCGDPSGALVRCCTRDVKIRAIERAARLATLRKIGSDKARLPDGVRVLGLIGLSVDEADRMKPSTTPWLDLAWPLIDLGLSRDDCHRIVADAGIPRFDRSACRHTHATGKEKSEGSEA